MVDAGGHPETVATLIRIATAKRLAARLADPRPASRRRGGKPPRWRARRSRSGRGATVATVPPAASPVPPVGAASVETPADEVSGTAR